jgi:hypothetical protein
MEDNTCKTTGDCMLHFMILVILLLTYAVTIAMRRLEEEMIERYQPRRDSDKRDQNLTSK